MAITSALSLISFSFVGDWVRGRVGGGRRWINSIGVLMNATSVGLALGDCVSSLGAK